jgi:predicted XRE-type DNA-binding protein
MPRKPRIEIAGYYHIINRGIDIKERNSKIVKAYKNGYSQHMIAKVLGISQPAVSGIVRRSR